MNTQLWKSVATEGKLSLGLVFPLESYAGSVPQMKDQERLARLAEQAGFKALWFRDVPFHDPSFGDAGQMFDPWVYMTHMMHHTEHIALATGSVILPLRHPVHTAKAVSSLQLLSGGRVFLGVASGDRPIEYPAFGRQLEHKGELFRDSFAYMKALWEEDFPMYQSVQYGSVFGQVDLLPKYDASTPLLVTGHSGQDLAWIAEHGDGWLYYPRDFAFLRATMQRWRSALGTTGQGWKPYMQSLYIDLLADRTASPRPIHLGFQSGMDYLSDYLRQVEEEGVNHVIINLKFSSRPVEAVINDLGELIHAFKGG